MAGNSPDRNVSAERADERGDPDDLRRLLDDSDVLDVFDEAIRRRFGQFISAAAANSKRGGRQRH